MANNPNRASLREKRDLPSWELDFALARLSLPRRESRPQSRGGREPIRAGIGRFGPYVRTRSKPRQSPKPARVFKNIGLKRAGDHSSRKSARKRSELPPLRRRTQVAPMASLPHQGDP